MEPNLLAHLIDTKAAALVLFARQWCDAPDDVVQEAFIKLAGQRQAPDKPVSWLYRVVRNGAISAARSRDRRRTHEAQAAAARPAWFAGGDDDPLSGAAAAEAMRGLPLEQREPIVAHLWGGLSFQEIAEMTGSSSSTVHRAYVAGLTALRERLGVPCPKKI